MKDGFIRVGAVTPDTRVANPAYNGKAAAEAAAQAAAAGVRVLVFPELTLTTYACSDLFFQTALLTAAENALRDYAERTKDLDMISFIGVPVPVREKLYNCAAAVCRGRILALIPKTFIPGYGEFYEPRQFSAAPDAPMTVSFAGQECLLYRDVLICPDGMPQLRIAAEICEDLWVADAPSNRHALAGANLIVNLSASDEVVGKPEYRRDLVRIQSARLLAGYVYCDAGRGESGTDMVFSGHNIIAEGGSLLTENPPFGAQTLTYAEVDVERVCAARRRTTTFGAPHMKEYLTVTAPLTARETELSHPAPRFPFVPDDPAHRRDRCELILNIQSRGLASRWERAHAKTAVIGVSGGLDSTLALLVAVRAADSLGRDRRSVTAVTMPCFGTTVRTKSNAEALAEALGVTLRVVDIRAAVEQHFADIGHAPDQYDTVYENAQARERTQVLMDIANAEGGLVVGTGDLSELALGWATYNGDHMSMYAVNASVPKTLVRHIVDYYAETAEEAGEGQVARILRDVLDTPVSPELLPPSEDGKIAQQTEGIVGPYELHDYFLYYLVRFGFTPRKIYRMACATFRGIYDENTVRSWLTVFIRRFFAQQFKRSCLPDGPKVGTVTFSPRADWRMPSDADVEVWLADLEQA